MLLLGLKATKSKNYNTNLVQNKTIIYITRKKYAGNFLVNWKVKHPVFWKQYQIKETDMRIKTASFESPQNLDLTTGQYCVLITSPYHENFSGIILKKDYDKETGLYTYQCQDWSRVYQSKYELINTNANLHAILRCLLTHWAIGLKPSKKQLKNYKKVLSGLRPGYQYEQKYWGSIINFNPMKERNGFIAKDKSCIELIRDLVYGTGAYIDIHFNQNGVLQIEPFHKDDWMNTGLHLTHAQLSNEQYTFDTTNVITGVEVQSNEDLKYGNTYHSSALIDLSLAAFFGNVVSSISNPNEAKKKNN